MGCNSFSSRSRRMVTLFYSHNLQSLFRQDKHASVRGLEPKDFVIWRRQCHYILIGMFSSFFGLLVNIDTLCAVRQRGKGHIWSTSGELSITFGCLDVTKCIKSPDVRPVVIITGVGLWLPEKSIDIMAYTECWRKVLVQACIEDPLVNC